MTGYDFSTRSGMLKDFPKQVL